MAPAAIDLRSAIAQVGSEIDALFEELLPVAEDQRAPLYEAMRYASIGGGKRLRPLLVAAASQLFAIPRDSALRAGLAVECIHVYSLIHDDLPCMDDDDLRRGKPTTHKAFDECTAVLAGDCLHDLAFQVLADSRIHADPAVRIELVAELARASGPAGMAGGQMMDLMAAQADMDLGTVTRLQQLKTGALIAFCLEAAAIMARLPADERTSLRGYAHDLGLAFQIADDLLDVEGDEAVTGKKVGKDDAAGKETFVSLLGVDRARRQAQLLVDQAVDHLKTYGPEADLLRAIARFAVERDH
ncbi:polyprenyl synthetase family protein [Allosphingosinicella flava]|uniref:Polyprenyl synthetase family protein n=1 Tax=Allosphingosinicella flava TaxID=2771430 RepID=A0A7T2GM02_9SPHN|nr:farnesyl diphosphate synthase [Sphingosinicella flava]QPQ56252.1 polyprenyl synthetase family protein [Sphingosinicella flava]